MPSRCYKCLRPIEGSSFEGLHPECFASWFGLKKPEPFSYIAKESPAPDSDMLKFFHGKFPKYSALLGGKHYLMKFGTDEVPELCCAEYLCNQIARHIGLDVPDYFLIKYRNKEDAFVCYNFMQDYSGVDLVHIYRFLDQPEDFTCIGLIEVLKRTLPQESQAKGIEQFIWLTLFDALIGNDDRHGRNIGLIHTPDGYTLAPFFDNPSYIGTESPLFLGFELNPTGAIATNTTQEPTMRDYALQFTELGYAYHVASFKKRAHNPEIQYLIKRSLLSDQRQNAFLTLLERRREELNG